MINQVDRYVLIAHMSEPVSGNEERYLALSGDRKAEFGSRYSIEVVPYHWNDRKKFNNILYSIKGLYKNSKQANEIPVRVMNALADIGIQKAIDNYWDKDSKELNMIDILKK